MPDPALEELPEEMVEAVALEMRSGFPDDGSDQDQAVAQDAAYALRNALKAAPTPFLARLLIERLGGEEEAVKRMAAAFPEYGSDEECSRAALAALSEEDTDG